MSWTQRASSRAHQLRAIPLNGFLARRAVPPTVDQPSWLGHRDPNLDGERRWFPTHGEHSGLGLAQHRDRVGMDVAGNEDGATSVRPAEHRVLGVEAPLSAARLALVDGCKSALANGLHLLGIGAPEEM